MIALIRLGCSLMCLSMGCLMLPTVWLPERKQNDAKAGRVFQNTTVVESARSWSHLKIPCALPGKPWEINPTKENNWNSLHHPTSKIYMDNCTDGIRKVQIPFCQNMASSQKQLVLVTVSPIKSHPANPSTAINLK